MRSPLTRSFAIAGALSALLLATSCASEHEDGLKVDPEANHPISVEPAMATLNLPFTTAAAGLLPQDEARLENFVATYLTKGNGAISILAPEGAGADAALHYFGARLTALGVPAQRILVGTSAQAGALVSLRFIDYRAEVAPCGGWGDVSATADNLPMENLGCATQHNTAAMVADPRDLIAPRGMASGDTTRRATVMQKYEQGEPTGATKGADQSVKISDAGSGG